MFRKQRLNAAGLLVGAGVASAIYCAWRRRKGPAPGPAPNPGPAPGPASSPASSPAPAEGQAEIRRHLDSIQACVDGLREEVSSLKDCIQGIAGAQGGGGRGRGRGRHEARRGSADSFTAGTGRPSDSGSEAGETEIPAGLDCSVLAFTGGSFTDGRVGLGADSSFLHLRQEIGSTTTRSEAEVEKDEEEVSNLVQVLNFSSSMEPEGDSTQTLKTPEDDENEIGSLLQAVDRLHNGTKAEQEQGFKVLLDNKNKYGKRKEFCWRMIRAYRDMFLLTEDKETQKCFALAGRDEGTASLKDHENSMECQIWLAVVSGYLEDHEEEDRSEGNEDLKEIEDEAGVFVELINSFDITNSAPDVVPEIAEATNKVEDVQSRRESNILVEVINRPAYNNNTEEPFPSFDVLPDTISLTDSSDITDIEDRNKEQDKKALDEANLMVEFIDGYHITYRNECSLGAPDIVKTGAMDSDNAQDEAGEATDAHY